MRQFVHVLCQTLKARILQYIPFFSKFADVNECGLDKGGCDHKCVNKAGTYRCACDEGYTLARDNRTCLESNSSILKHKKATQQSA